MKNQTARQIQDETSTEVKTRVLKYANNEIRKHSVLKACINKMLEPYGVNYEFVVDNPVIDGQDWYHYYTFKDESERTAWMDFCVQLIRKELRMSKKMAQKMVDNLDLFCGLRSEK